MQSILRGRIPDELFSLARFIGVSRPGDELSASHLPTPARVAAGRCEMLGSPLAISSTECHAARCRRETGLVPRPGRHCIHRQAWAYRRWPTRPTVSAPG